MRAATGGKARTRGWGRWRALRESLDPDDRSLLVLREDSGELRPRFRNRLMFPILDVAGNCTGFGGRLLGPGEPKYLNSSESPVYSKGRMLYGLHMAKHAIRREGRVMIVEGYFDVVRLVSAGFDAHVDDPLAGMNVTADGFREMALRCRAAAPRVAAVLEGGYNLDTLPALVDATLEGLISR